MSEGSDRSVELDDLEAMEYACVCLLEKGVVGGEIDSPVVVWSRSVYHSVR